VPKVSFSFEGDKHWGSNSFEKQNEMENYFTKRFPCLFFSTFPQQRMLFAQLNIEEVREANLGKTWSSDVPDTCYVQQRTL